MKPKNQRCLTAIILLGIISLTLPALAQFDRTALLIDAPTADVLPKGSLAITAVTSLPLVDTRMNLKWERGAGLRFSPIDRLELALTAYTRRDYVLGFSYQILSPKKSPLALAIGVHDLGLHSYISPVGHGENQTWPDWAYTYRQMERPSIFLVTSIPVLKIARIHAGLGRGRNVGYGNRSKYFNTDLFFDEKHQWAVGLFGGVEINFTPNIGLAIEAQGRDLNAGVKANFGPVHAGLALTKLEGLILTQNEENRFGRIAFGLSYHIGKEQFEKIFRKPAPVVPPPPTPEVVAETTEKPVAPQITELAKIYFDFDKSDIRPGDAEILKQNAGQIKNLIDQGKKPTVTIEGHCCPIGTSEYNMALGWRRAESAKSYLIKLGIDAKILNTISYGEERLVTNDPNQYHLNRRCEFKLETK